MSFCLLHVQALRRQESKALLRAWPPGSMRAFCERLHALSPMPRGLLNSFEREEILDLLAYLMDPE